MLKLLAGYFKEREGFSLLGDERGFITFKKQDDNSYYIRELYVAPDFRQSRVASSMADQVVSIAKANESHKLVGSVSESDPNRDRNIKVLHGYGMKYGGFNKDLNLLIFEKEI